MRKIPLLVIMILAAAMLVSPANAAAGTSVNLDGATNGRTFDGIGAISGGGDNSRLLTDYPEPQRDQILDYLFKPGYGANLQMLKIEIGGDANSTDGSEPSVEHSKGTVNCDAGYEFWLAEQAKARNPNIKLYGLAWAAPGWIGDGSTFWSPDTTNYLMTWLDCAKSHNLTVDYLGGWNERGYDKNWYEGLRSTLDAKGYGAVKVVGADSDWSVADDLVSDGKFAKSVDIVGAHYPCEGGDGGSAVSCSTTDNAVATGKPLWASENGSQDINSGTGALIRSITRGYLDAHMTAYLNWPLLAAIYPNLPYSTVGLAVAPQPWSGSYSLGKSTWATAQVTQFAKPGWNFVDSASGYLGGDRTNGSYVTLKSPNGSDYSTMIETSTATAAQDATFTVGGGLPTSGLHVWATSLGDGPDFVHSTDVTPTDGKFSLTLQPNMIYTMTTTTGQGKGAATSPAPAPLSLPYNDNFDSYNTGSEAKYLSDMQGSYEVQPCSGGRAGKCVRQMTPLKPIEWQDDSDAFSLIGDTGWGNYTVSSDVFMAQPGAVELLGRANTQARPQSHQNAYYFRVSDTGAWSILRGDTGGALTTLASGTTTAPGTGSWHKLAITFQDNTITGSLDGNQIGSATDSLWSNGQAGIGVVGYQTDEFDNLSITPGSGSPTPRAGTITSGIAGKCADGGQDSRVTLLDCDNDPNTQQWTVVNGTLQAGGKCMDVTNEATGNGTPVGLWQCTGGANQQWLPQANGTLVSMQSGSCLDDPGSSTDNGTQLVIWGCNGGANQHWTLPN